MQKGCAAAVIAALAFMGACATAPVSAEEAAPTASSAVFDWNELAVVTHDAGQRRAVMDAPSRTLENLEMHITTLNPYTASHPPHQHANEEAVFVHQGTLEVYLNGVKKRVGPGSVLVFLSNDWHAVQNVGDTPAIYYVINWTTPRTRQQPPPMPKPVD